MRVLIIGGVAAGMSAAARAKRLQPAADVTVVEKGPHVSWAACGLPYFLEGRLRSLEELILYSPRKFEEERGVTVRTHAEVVEILPARRQALLASGERLDYDRLILGVGARAADRPAGADQPHVFSLLTLQDAARLDAFLRERKPRRAVVIGAGYIGLEAAEALRFRGLSVSVVDAAADVLDRSDAHLTTLVQAHLERCGVQLILNTPVPAIEPSAVCGIPSDLVITATGLRPNTALAQAAGIAVGRSGAIATDVHMETNLSGIFAAGDCAETTHLVTGRPTWIPLGTTANKMGRVAGANAAGRRERFAGVLGSSIVRVCGLAVGATGLSVEQARRHGFRPVAARIEARERPRYFLGKKIQVELVADASTGKLLGATITGEAGVPGRVNTIAAALARGMTASELVDLDLVYAPPYAQAMDPLLIAAQQLVKLLD